MADLKDLKNLTEEDRKLIQAAEMMLGAEPSEMGFVKNIFWGNIIEEMVFPYPIVNDKEKRQCDQLLDKVDKYFRDEHPSIQIDRDEEIPKWVIDRLFKLGVMGMTIPKEYGGLGMSVSSYNRILERIGRSCASTAVVVSAHQSIGCKAIILFGTEEQKQRWLPMAATSKLSAFCLSEPNVGCDAGGQETRCELSEDGKFYILNGEKKWATSAALSGLFTVAAKQAIYDSKTGKTIDKVSALVCTPDMEGVDIFQSNRSKCGIRGTWQARIRFTNVKVPRENLLYKEGRGLHVGLTCLNYGRCTLASGMLGAARRCMDQAIKWSQTRYQFGKALSSFDLVKDRIANMAALTYAMDAMLYMTTGMLDRKEKDVMVETAICKVFCSEMGWRVVNDAMQIMGGESYMTENEVERAFRDSRINLIVEGANEVMHTFVFGYGGKQLAEQMISIQQALLWDSDQSFAGNIYRIVKNVFNPTVLSFAVPLGLELFLGIKKQLPVITKLHPSLANEALRLCKLVQNHSHQVKLLSKKYREKIMNLQTIQKRISENAMLIHAIACTLSKLDRQIRSRESGLEFERDKSAALHFIDSAEVDIKSNLRALHENADKSMRVAADAALKHNDTLDNKNFVIPEQSPNAKGTGRVNSQEYIKQFNG
ncbi:MAG: acyl-CoA dehydrogenase family protein [Candidatus Anammoxibacter sp.]